ncbi:LamG-like jellyroll fold domain-containing protein [Nostoc sp.]|uniref:LamG-like jellyroll fold domain-containing protein n=1 Tax=Nostoc sp. TaxID=1180 RepID=UPI002FFC6918
MQVNSDSATSYPQTSWIKQAVQGFEHLSGIPENSNFLENLEPEDEKKIIAIFEERSQLLSAQIPSVSVADDERDVLPISSLSIGVKRSLAVCRIARYFPLKDFQDFLEGIKKEITERNDDTNFNTLQKVKEIFLIPDNIFHEVFDRESPEKEQLKGLYFLEKLKNICDRKLAIMNPIPIGTGFLVGVTHLITNHHVISNKEIASQCVAQFNYIEDSLGYTQRTIDYELNPDIFFIKEPNLDYALIQLKSSMFTRQAGYNFDWIQLIEDDMNICPIFKKEDILKNHDDAFKSFLSTSQDTEHGDNIIIVHHPKGKQKKIDINNNYVLKDGLYKNFLRYKVDSDYGSSGGLVVNTKWEAVALHHAAIPNKDQKAKIIAQQGVRICRIVEDLKNKSFNDSKLASFIEDFVVTSEQLNYPPLPSALEFNGESSYVDLGFHDLDINKGITFEAWIKRNSMSGDGTIVSQTSQNSVFSLSWEKGKIWVNVKSQSKKYYTREAVLNDNSWHHVVLTLNQQEIQVYLDGKSLTIEGSQPYQNIGESKNNLLLGWAKSGYFNGFMAEVRIWRIKHEEREIRENMYRRLAKDERKKLTGYWRFEEAEGYKVDNLARDNTSTAIEESKCNGFKDFGLELNGKNDYIDCGKDENLKFENEITIEAWVKSSTENEMGIIVNQGGSWNEEGYCLWKFNKNIRVELQNKNEKIVVDTVGVFLIDNHWYHLAFTWSGKSDSKEIQIYIDGEKQRTNPVEGTLFQGPIGEPKVNLNIGHAQDYGYYFNGAIAEVRLWNIARTEDQIKENKDKQLKVDVDKQGLVGYWRLDEEEGDTAKNLALNGGDGIVRGGKWLKPYCLLANNQGAFGVAYRTNRLKASQYPGLPLPFSLKFNQEGDRVDCGSHNLAVSEAITVEAWFKHKFGNCVIVSQVDEDHNGYSLSWNSGRIRVALQSPNSSEEKFVVVVYTKENAPQDSVWHHIAFTWERESKEVSLYIDGRIQDCVVEGSSETIVFAGQTRSIGLFTGSLDNLTANLLIGCKEEKETYYPNVAIADVRLWNIVRTQDEIKANMSRRLTFTDEENNLKHLVGYWRLDDGGEDNLEVQNLVPNRQPGKIIGATWFPQPPKAN